MSNPRCSYFRLSVFSWHALELTPFPHSGQHGKRTSSTSSRPFDEEREGKCLKAQGTPLKTISIVSSHSTISNVTHHPPMHTLKHLYSRACLLMVLYVNYLPVEMQEQSNWRDLHWRFPFFSYKINALQLMWSNSFAILCIIFLFSQLSAITTALMTFPEWVTYRSTIPEFVVSLSMCLLHRLFVSPAPSQAVWDKCCLTLS